MFPSEVEVARKRSGLNSPEQCTREEELLASKPRPDLSKAEKERKNKQRHGKIKQLAQQFVG